MKPLTLAALRLLSDGEFHSGEEMAHKLEVSRTGVWQALQAAQALGIEVHSVRGRGYRLAPPMSWLNAEAVQAHLGGIAAGLNLTVLDRTDSTNTELLRQAQQGAPHASCIAAEWQAAGRGRMGRTWMAALGGSLTFSLLWRFEQGIAHLSGLSLAVGVAIVRALGELGVDAVGLKWPNDVLFDDRKLAGILIEVQGDALGPSAAVIGIGLNVRLAAKARAVIDQAVADLHEVSPAAAADRNRLLATLLTHLTDVLSGFAANGFAAMRAEWLDYHLYHDRDIRLLHPNGGVEAVHVAGVDESGALLVEVGSARRQVHAGEISLRRAKNHVDAD